MSIETFGGGFALLEAPPLPPGTIEFGGGFALLEEPPPDAFVKAFGGGFGLLEEGPPEPFTFTFGGGFALEAMADTNRSVVILKIDGVLTEVPLLFKSGIGGHLVDPISGAPWSP